MNTVLLSAILGTTTCKIAKTIVNLTTKQGISLKTAIFGGGSMPSTRGGICTALVYSTGYCYGVQGFEFAMAVTFAFIMFFDSVYIRKEVEKHTNILKEHFDDIAGYKLKTYSGHTMIQLLAGCLLGLVVAILTCYLCK